MKKDTYMKKNTEKIPNMSYYELLLLQRLRESFPTSIINLDDKAESFPPTEITLDFIKKRGDAAALAKEDNLKSGLSEMEADKVAMAILYENFTFSMYETLVEVIDEEFSELWDVSDNEMQEFAKKLLLQKDKEIKEITKKYTITDDFVDTEEFYNLRLELTGFIADYAEKNGTNTWDIIKENI